MTWTLAQFEEFFQGLGVLLGAVAVFAALFSGIFCRNMDFLRKPTVPKPNIRPPAQNPRRKERQNEG